MLSLSTVHIEKLWNKITDKQGIKQFDGKSVLVPADKAGSNAIVV